MLPVGPGSVRKSGGNLGNPLVEKSALAVAGTPSAVGACWRISGGVMHHESACKSEFRVRFPEWGHVLDPGRKIMDTLSSVVREVKGELFPLGV